METKNSTYLILSIILLILSAFGGYFLFQNFQSSKQSSYNSTSVPKIEQIPTDTIEPEPTIPESTISAKTTITPQATTSATNKITPTKIPTKILTPTLTPTKSISPTSAQTGLKTYSSSEDGFSIAYSFSRVFTQDTESSGNRYTFSSSVGNFAVHVSSSGLWAWTYPDRQFSTGFTVSGQPTFRYDIATQTIVDLQSSDKNYTLQCVHNGKDSVKAECEAFLASFKLL